MELLKGEHSAARQSRNQTGLVGAPLVGAHHKGTHEGCPYETRKMFAKKTSIYGIAMQPPGFGVRGFSFAMTTNR